MDFFDELDQRSIVGRVDEDGVLLELSSPLEFPLTRRYLEIEIPYGAMPPDPDDGDSQSVYRCFIVQDRPIMAPIF